MIGASFENPENFPPRAAAPSRESFLALYWDHARSIARFNLCTLAGIPAADVPELVGNDWDFLTEWERAKLRRAVVDFLPIHDATRAAARRDRALRGEVAG